MILGPLGKVAILALSLLNPFSKEWRAAMACQVISLSAYRKTKEYQVKRQLNKLLSQLSLMRALIGVYQQEMTQASQEPEVLVLCEDRGIDAAGQIAADVARLYRLEACLRESIVDKGAKDLGEASQLLRFWAPQGVIETLDQLLASTYSGFKKMAELIYPGTTREFQEQSN